MIGIKLKAAAQTAKLFAIATGVPVLLVFLFQIDPETLFYVFLFAFFSWMVWVVYSINLGQLESEEKVREIRARNENMLTDK